MNLNVPLRPWARKAHKVQHVICASTGTEHFFREVLQFFQCTVPADIRSCDFDDLTIEAVVLQDYRPVDIAVRVTLTGDGDARAAFVHRTMTDIVRFHLVVRAAERALVPDTAPPTWELLPFDFPEGCFKKDDWASTTLPVLLAQACTGPRQQREEAAAELASCADSHSACRLPLAGALAERPGAVEGLFRAGFAAQYPAAVAVAQACACPRLQADVSEALGVAIARLLGGRLPAAVRKVLARAKQSLDGRE